MEKAEYSGPLPPIPLEPNREIYFGTTRAIGTPSEQLLESIKSSVERARFHSEIINLRLVLERSQAIRRIFASDVHNLEGQGYVGWMNAGNLLRLATARGDAVVIEALSDMDTLRTSAREAAMSTGSRGVAYVFKTLVHPDEIRTLRRLYDRTFFGIAAFSPEDLRERVLARRVAASGMRPVDARNTARNLMVRDSDGGLNDDQSPNALFLSKFPERRRYMANISKTFQYADLFVDATERMAVPEQVRRFVDLLFGDPFETPTATEVGMGFAYQAAMHSGNLSRQVGAAITSPSGDLLAIGTNDTPRAGGGSHSQTPLFAPRKRDLDHSSDVSDETRRAVFTDLVRRLSAEIKFAEPVRARVQTTRAVGHDIGEADAG